MQKSAYLQDPFVANFINWMSDNLDSDVFAHQYTDRRSGAAWSCGSLYDAYVHYQWPHPEISRLKLPAGSSFDSSSAVLGALCQNLNGALESPDNYESVLVAAVDVMTWGGVRAGNVRWLIANQSDLPSILSRTRDALDESDTSLPLLVDRNLRFNAGMTKIYSLICDEFVIYDSRVAAALGWAVVKFCHASGLTSIPQALSFPWAPAKSAAGDPSPKLRNAGCSTLIFPKLRSGAAHAAWNLKASWLLAAVLEQVSTKSSGFNQLGNIAARLRALEAALFMIGYDLGGAESDVSAGSVDLLWAPTPESEGESFWIESQTLSKGNPFRYRLAESGIFIENGPTFTLECISSTLAQLWRHFGESAFPLANSATGVRDGSVPNGIGRAYFDATRGNPPDTSKLAAVLEELGAIVPACQWPLILTHFWPIKLTHLGTANRQFSASADSSHLPA